MSGAFQNLAFQPSAFQMAPVTGPYTHVLTIGGVVLTGDTEWSMTWEERSDGSPGTFSAVVQDRTNSLLIGVARRDIVKLTLEPGGFVLYWGEVVSSVLDLPVGMLWGRWKFRGTDWNTIPDLRLVGTPSGEVWVSFDGGLTFQTDDPFAQSAAGDALTVQRLFSNFGAAPAGGPGMNASAYVSSYVPYNLLVDPVSGQSRYQWSHAQLRSALDDVRSLGEAPIYMWIDPAGFVHWKIQADMNSAAPAILTDDHPDGVTSIGCRALSFGFDGTYMPEKVWVNGTLDYLYNGGVPIAQGTGWGDAEFGSLDQTKRQISVDAQAATAAQRLAVGTAYSAYTDRAQVKISVTCAGRPDEQVDGWRCGQTVTITDARLPASLNGLSWPIHRVAGSLVSANPTLRLYTLECGDMPIGRFFAKYRTSPKAIATPRKPAYTWEIYFQNLAPAPGEAQTLVLQALDSSKKPVRAPGLACDVTLTVTLAGSPVTSDASVSPASGVSNADGQVSVIFTADSTTGGLTYKVDAATPAVA